MTASRITPIPALRSMTGFGRAEATGDAATVTVEARSVNHRHLDIALRLPRALGPFEMDARRMIQSRLERGRIDVAVQLGPAPGQSTQQVRADATQVTAFRDPAAMRDQAGQDGQKGRDSDGSKHERRPDHWRSER